MKTTHTPLPWRIGVRTAHSKRDIYGPKGELVTLSDAVFTSLEEAQANAAFIVRACNNHYDLIAALEAIMARLKGEFDHPALMAIGPLSTTDADIGTIAEAALSKAKG